MSDSNPESTQKPDFPSGTITFLFTDMEGSTKLAQRHPDQWESLRSRHHAILKSAIESNTGYTFQIIGDAFCAAFHTAGEAIQAANKAQIDLQAENWGEAPVRVRMGIHTGKAVIQEDGQYSGYVTLCRVQRLMSAGHGGQTLVSQTSRDLVRDELPQDLALRDLGERRLKDLTRPERIFQLLSPGLPADFPPLKTLDSISNNLPVQLTSFIGREKEIRAVKQLLDEKRLVTLTGPGGTGKTRLALQTAADLPDAFPNGVWLVELAPLADPGLLPQTVASALGVREQQGRSVQDTLTDYLREKELLLILDNCEHLVEACAALADALLHACPGLKILASSRETLGIAGEVPFRVPPLSIPVLRNMPGSETGIPDLARYESVELFIDRTLGVRSGFQVTGANAAALAKVCQRLDGIPLAIELAAARMKAMSVEEIAVRIDDRFRLLTGGSRTALPRQQTLRALIDWSYDLLLKAEQVLLYRLAVFAGGWTLEAAETVCSDPGKIPTEDVLDLLTRLVDKSLVIAEEQSGETRFHLLETIRQYARDKLLESGEAEAMHGRQLEYYLAYAERMQKKLNGPAELAALEQLEHERDNFRLALEWSLGAGRVESGLRLAGALMWYWDIQGYGQEGREWVASMLVHPEAAKKDLARARALLTAAILSDDFKAEREYLEELVPLARELGEAGRWLLAMGLADLSYRVFGDDPAAGEAMLEEAMALARSLHDPWLTALMLRWQGWNFLGKRDFTASHKAFEESLNLFRAAGDRRNEALSKRGAAAVRFIQHDFAAAIQQFEEILLFFRSVKDRPNIVNTLTMLSEMERANDRYDVAEAYCLESLNICQDLGYQNESLLFQLGSIALHAGDLQAGRDYFAEFLANAQKWHNRQDLAYAMLGFGGVLAREQKPQPAAVLLTFFHAFFESGDRRYYTPTDDMDYERSLAAARAQLDEAAFQEACAQGRAWTLEQALACVQEYLQAEHS